MHRLPPLNAVRAFEAAARHLSFTRAAQELCVTAGAVSRQIGNLEQFLGTRLFQRLHRKLALTRSGERYVHEVRDALGRIARATSEIAPRRTERLLRLKLPPTFAIRWLLPRLGRFHAHHPELSVQVTTSHDPPDFDEDEVDAAVHYSTELAREFGGERLFPECLIPVCTPELAARLHPRGPAGLAAQVLLHSLRRPDDWPRWFAEAGVPGTPIERSLVFENSSMTYQGAMDGLGIAIAHLAFVQDELRTGRLASPAPLLLRRDVAYFLSYPRNRDRATIHAFHQWIGTEAAETRGTLALPVLGP
jgi:LysR family transcriptional regulator, glycine cleavage system transcriptional activator